MAAKKQFAEKQSAIKDDQMIETKVMTTNANKKGNKKTKIEQNVSGKGIKSNKAKTERLTKREKAERVKSDFQKANKLIQETILTNKAPDNKIDITKQYLLSTTTLGDYVTLDWQHREEIIKLCESIQKYSERNKVTHLDY